MKIYTKTGDNGETGLFGGQRVSKDSPLIEACGVVDELNAVLGLASALCDDLEITAILTQIQNELFTVGADIATPDSGIDSKSVVTMPRIRSAHIERLESEIDKLTAEAGQLTHFILPGGSQIGAQIHFARCVCRRAERVVVHASQTNHISANIKVYLNRLSDHLFELARVVNKRRNIPETIWSRETAQD